MLANPLWVNPSFTHLVTILTISAAIPQIGDAAQTPFIGHWCRPIVYSASALTPSRLPHTLDAWQLPHYTERFSLRMKIEALWEGTGVNAYPCGPAEHSSVSLMVCLGLAT
jgi:hypothetical protein